MLGIAMYAHPSQMRLVEVNLFSFRINLVLVAEIILNQEFVTPAKKKKSLLLLFCNKIKDRKLYKSILSLHHLSPKVYYKLQVLSFVFFLVFLFWL